MEDERETMQDIRERLVKIEVLLEGMKTSNEIKVQNLEDKLEEKIKVANKRIADLEDSNRWLWRTIAIAIITCIGTILVNLIKF